MRVVSLLPSATEVVCALGHEGDLVGRSEECDYPVSVQSLPVLMRAKLPPDSRSSAEIDRDVRRLRGASESLYWLDLERLRALRPELLLTQDLCGVCSVTEAEVQAACRQTGLAPQVLSVSPRTLGEVWESFRSIARALGHSAPLPAGLDRPPTAEDRRSGRRPRVAVVEWADPPILAGLWTPEIVHAAGGDPIGPRPGEPGERTTYEEVGRRRPDLLVIAPCSFGIERTRAELRAPRIHDALERLDPSLGIWVADEAYFSRPGPRLAHGVEFLRRLLGDPSRPARLPFFRWSGCAEVLA